MLSFYLLHKQRTISFSVYISIDHKNNLYLSHISKVDSLVKILVVTSTASMIRRFICFVLPDIIFLILYSPLKCKYLRIIFNWSREMVLLKCRVEIILFVEKYLPRFSCRTIPARINVLKTVHTFYLS